MFSFELLSSETDPAERFNNADKSNCVIISNVDELGFALTSAERLTAEVLEAFVDVTVFAKDFSWTYCKTHESSCGPYYYRK